MRTADIANLDRSRNVGELLDRAIHLTIRNFGLLLTILGLPLVLIGTFNVLAQAQAFDPFLRAAHLRVHAIQQVPAPLLLADLATLLILLPLSGAAAVTGIARSTVGERATFLSAYRAALPRWLGACFWWVTTLLLFWLVFFAMFRTELSIAGLGVHLATYSVVPHNLARAVSISLMTGMALAALIGILIEVLIFGFGVAGFGEITLGTSRITQSLGRAWYVISNRRMRWHSFWLALVAAIIFMITYVGGEFGGILAFGFSGSDVFNVLIRWIVGLVTWGFLGAFCVAYHYDAKQRERRT